MALHRAVGAAGLLLAALAVGACRGGTAGDPPALDAGPAFALPWPQGETWFLVGGPHCDSGGDDCGAQPRYAVDFAPVAPMSGNACRPGALEAYWVAAAAAGTVQVAGRSLVEIEHEDGLRSGYYHLLTSSLRVAPGEQVEAGDLLGRPSCEHLRGGASRGAHVHFYLCRGVPDGETCLDSTEALLTIDEATLSGWRVVAAPGNYEGYLEHEDKRRVALNLRCDGSELASGECGGRRNDVLAE